jgi:hypothetical protein
MPITVAVAITSAIALIVHSVYLRRVWLNRQEQKHSAIDGDRTRIVNAFFNMEVTRFAINLCWAVGTIGLIQRQTGFGYLLALAPVLSIVSSSFALRGIR